jgi:hypothetical protein
MKNELHNLFANNRRWAAAIRDRDPAFFETLAASSRRSTCGSAAPTAACRPTRSSA